MLSKNKYMAVAMNVCLCLFGADVAFALQSDETPEAHLQVTNLRNNLFLIDDVLGKDGPVGGNIVALIGDEGVFLGDTFMPGQQEKLIEALKTITAAPVRFVAYTHYHQDHAGGVSAFRDSATVIANENAYLRFSENENRWARRPNIGLKETAVLHLNDETVKFRVFKPAHTDTDTVIFYEKANVVQMGDNYFSRMLPFVDETSGGSIDGVIDLIESVLELTDENTKFVPGHGPVTSQNELRDTLTLLKETRKITKDAIAENIPIEKLLTDDFRKKYQRWADGYINLDVYFADLYKFYSAK